MKLFRINRESMCSTDLAVEQLASGACEILQLDWCLDSKCKDVSGFLSQWQRIHKFFYLDQRLKLITNAGAGGVVRCAEAMGEYLREHGDSQVPLTAIRGDNLLPRLPELFENDAEFIDELSGEQIPITSAALVSAHVELGAGPIATAFAEESRIVILGSYDPAAPFVAAGVSAFNFNWDDYESLGTLAIASVLSERFAVTAELSDTGRVHLKSSDSSKHIEQFIEEWLHENLQNEMRWADVSCSIDQLRIEQPRQEGFLLQGLTASPPNNSWLVKLVFRDSDEKQRVGWSRVPRDMINVSVDTRPASEWL